jgi:anti-sigma regulatory factor (Ser/Thr protein kinase)
METSNDGGGTTVELTVGSNLQAAGVVRAALEEIRPSLSEVMYGDLRLLLSELVVNAVRHAGLAEHDPIRVNVRCSSGSCQAEVLDGGMGFEVPAAPVVIAKDQEAGYGLAILDGIASRWGVERVAGHTRVWFELRDSPGATVDRA